MRPKPRLQSLEPRLAPAGTGLIGRYYDNADFTAHKLTRTDPLIHFDWGTGSPAAAVAADTFSVRWTGRIEPPHSGPFTFRLAADDGAKLWIDNRLVAGRWFDSPTAREVEGTVHLDAGRRHDVRIEYVERTGSASVRLAWSGPERPLEIVPTDRLYPDESIDDRGSVRVETWAGLAGIHGLAADMNFPNRPTNRSYLTELESGPSGSAGPFARRIAGHVRLDRAATVTFAVAGDSQVSLALSPTASPADAKLIAVTLAPTAPRDFFADPLQQSQPITLSGGQSYYLEVRHAGAAGSDHFSVGWKFAGDPEYAIVPGSALIPLGADAPQPPQSQLLATLARGRPRLFATPERFARLRLETAAGQPLAGWFATLRSRADAMLGQPVNTYDVVGGRLLAVSRSVLDRMYTLGIVYQITLNPTYAERAWAELEAAANFPDWHPAHFLDTAEMTHAFAVGLDWFHDYWSAARLSTIRSAIVGKGLTPGLAAYNGNVWWSRDTSNNWNFVCNGGLAFGALAVADVEPVLAADIIHRAIHSTRPLLGHFTADAGGWYEGPGYWDYSTDYVVRFFDALETNLGSDFGLSRTPGVADTGRYAIEQAGANGATYNFSDVGGTGRIRGPQLFWLARRFGQPDLANYQRSFAAPEALDLVWHDARGGDWRSGRPTEAVFVGPTNTNAYRPAEIVTLRSGWDSSASYVGVKGNGKIGDSHGHLDAGNFIFESRGVRWAHELGSDNYNLPGYFSNPQRWTYYRHRAEGHNTLVINPGSSADQVLGSNNPVITVNVEGGSDRALTVTDLTSAYAGSTRVWRGVGLINGRRELLVQDEIVRPGASEVWWFMHVRLSPEQVMIAPDGRSAILTQGSERLYVKLLTPAGQLELRDAAPLPTSPNPAGQNPNVEFQKLAVRLTGVTQTTLAVWMVPLAPGEAIPTAEPAVVPLSLWGQRLNDPPTAAGGVITDEDTFVDFDLRQFVTDAETPVDRLKWELLGAANGQAQLLADGRTVRFTPSADFHGPASVSVAVRDTWADPRLLLHYDFDQPFAADVADQSGHFRPGTLSTAPGGMYGASTDTPPALAGFSTRALELIEDAAGNSARLSAAVPELNYNTQPWSFAGWFWRRDLQTDDFVFYLGNSDGYGTPNELQLVAPAGQSRLVLGHYPGPDVLIAAENVPAGVWHHAAVTFDGTEMKLYVNGQLVGSDNTMSLAMPAAPVVFGGTGSTTFQVQRWFDGRLDDVALFRGELTAGEVAQLASGTVAHFGGQSAVVSVPVTVRPVNDAPVVAVDPRATPPNVPIDLDLRAWVTDVETPPEQLRFTVGGAVHGTVVLLADGHTARFTPNPGYQGPAAFTFTVTDTFTDPRQWLGYTFEPPASSAGGFVPDSTGNARSGTLDAIGTGTFTDSALVPPALAPFSAGSLRLTNPSEGNAARLWADPSGLDLNAGPWTAAGWFRRASTTSDDFIFYLGNSDGYGSPNELQLYAPSGQSSWILRHYPGPDVSITKTGIPVNTWAHFAVTLDGGEMRLYVNGSLVGSDDTFDLNLPADSKIYFGGHGSTTFQTVRWADGWFDDLAVFDAALSPAEISALATRTVAHAAGLTVGPVPVPVTVAPPPRVVSAFVNGGAAQRSRVTDLTLTFDRPVTAAAGAFRVAGPSGDIAVSVNWPSDTAARLTFTGPGTSAGSLDDGNYLLTVEASAVSWLGLALDGDGDGVPGGQYTLAFHRLFGDADGDATVTIADFLAFRASFGQADPVFDADDNGLVDFIDFLAFRARFGVSLLP